MKRQLVFLFLLTSAICFGQNDTHRPPGYTLSSSNLQLPKLNVSGGLTIPHGVPGIYGADDHVGLIFYDTVRSQFRAYDGSYFRRYPDSIYKINDSSLVIRYGLIKDTLNVGSGSGSGGTETVSNTGTGYPLVKPRSGNDYPVKKLNYKAGHDIDFDSTTTANTITARIETWKNIKDYGALGDGTTNDRTSIINAVTDAVSEHKEVYLPRGTYKVVGNIDFSGATVHFAPGAYIKGGASNADTVYNLIANATAHQKIFDSTVRVGKLSGANGYVSVMWFGAQALGNTFDNSIYFDRALRSQDSLPAWSSYFNYGGRIYIPGSKSNSLISYYCTRTIEISRGVELYGDGKTSNIEFPQYTIGLWIKYSRSDTSPVVRGSLDPYIHDLFFYGGGGTVDSAKYGCLIEARCYIERVDFYAFGGDGVHVHGDVGGTPITNANLFYLNKVVCTNCTGHGFYTTGGDANAGTIQSCSAISNYRWGFYDNSFLGSTYIACHIEASGDLNFKAWAYVPGSDKVYVCKRENTNIQPEVTTNWQNYWHLYWSGSGAHGWNNWSSSVNYQSTGGYASVQNGNARNLFLGCYSEGDVGGVLIYQPALVIGGLLANADYLQDDVSPARLSAVQGGGTQGLSLTDANWLVLSNTITTATQFNRDEGGFTTKVASNDASGFAYGSYLSPSKQYVFGNSSFANDAVTSMYFTGSGYTGTLGRSSAIAAWSPIFSGKGLYIINAQDGTAAHQLRYANGPTGSNNCNGDFIFNGDVNGKPNIVGWSNKAQNSGTWDTLFVGGFKPQYATGSLPSTSLPAIVYDNTTVSYKGNFNGTWTSIATKTTLNVNTTDVGNVGGGEDDLITYAIPGGTLSTNGDYLEFEMDFACAANANSKTIKIYFGSTAYTFPAFTTSGTFVRCTGSVVRTGSTAQRFSLTVISDNGTTQTNGTVYLTPAETLSGSVTIKATGTGTSDNDIVQKVLIVKYFPNN